MPCAGPFVPTQALAAAHPRLAYQVFFDTQTHEAAAELERDIRRTLRGTLGPVNFPMPEDFLTSSDTFMGAWDHVEEVSVIGS
jgi:soluble epoxide hydrolase/lipid-phosphate phosphatase